MICIKQEKLPKHGNEGEKRSQAGRRAEGFDPSRRGRGNVYRGLTAAQAEESRRAHGNNSLTQRRGKRFWQRFASNLGDPIIRILLIALGLNLLLMFRESDWVETVGIAISVLLATTISTLSEHGSEAAFARLQAESTRTHCRVLRDGAPCELDIEQVVVGDVVLLGAGEHVVADGVLIEGALTLDQSGLTGESREVHKQAAREAVDTNGEALTRYRGTPDDASSLFRGCAVLAGSGRMLVSAVGDATVMGGISQEVQQEMRDSPLKIRLSRLAKQISVLGYAAAVLVAAVFLLHAFVLDSGLRPEIIRMKLQSLPYLADTLLHAVMLALTVVVVAVPEGLPMMIAVVLSANMRRMVRDRVLVRRAAGIEAAGSMDILFTDKTGTLTDGRLSVGRILAPEGDHESAEAFMGTGQRRGALYALSCFYGSSATVGRTLAQGAATRERGEGRRAVLGGNATDRALTASVAHLTPPSARVKGRLPFDSARKYAGACVELEDGRVLTLLQGAPEKLLPYVRRAYDARGERVPIDLGGLRERIRREAARGERVLLLALGEGETGTDALERGAIPELTLLCALTLSDRIRPEAKEAVRTLHGAGVQVVMITGDGPETAEQIARSCGILDGQTNAVLTGADLAGMSDHRLREILPRLAVVARALPSDKSRLVRVAQEQQRVVGMTGDGINDAPALRRADVGFAMGSGTSVAQSAGDVLILDDNLASIVRAVLYGRNIFKSIRKFITLQLTMNFCAVGVSMIGPFIGVDAPVTVVQMLWINLIMDTLGGLAFAGEAALPSCMRERPKRRDEPILCRYMIHEILLLGGYTVGLCVLFLKHPTIRGVFRATEGDLCHLTAFFALFIFASVFNCFNARSDRLRPMEGLSRNRLFLLIMGTILAVQVLFVYLGGSVLRTMPLTPRELLVTAALASSVLVAELLRKLLWRWRYGRERGRY